MTKRAATRRLTLDQSRQVVTYNMNADGSGWIGPSPETMAYVRASAVRDREREEEEKRVRQQRLAGEMARQERDGEARVAAWAAGSEQREVNARGAEGWHGHFARAPSVTPAPSIPPTAPAEFEPTKEVWHVGVFDTEGVCALAGKTHRTTCEATLLTLEVTGETGGQRREIGEAYQGFWKLDEEVRESIRAKGLDTQVNMLCRALHGISTSPPVRGAVEAREGLQQCLQDMAACDQVVARDPGRENALLRDICADPSYAELHQLASQICVYEVVDLLKPLDPLDLTKSLARTRDRPMEWQVEADGYTCQPGEFGDPQRGPHGWWRREDAEDFAMRALCKHKGRKASETAEEGKARARKERQERCDRLREMRSSRTLGNLHIHCHCARRDCYECAVWGRRLGWDKHKLEKAHHALLWFRATGGHLARL
jgi:hypothetical protein